MAKSWNTTAKNSKSQPKIRSDKKKFNSVDIWLKIKSELFYTGEIQPSISTSWPHSVKRENSSATSLHSTTNAEESVITVKPYPELTAPLLKLLLSPTQVLFSTPSILVNSSRLTPWMSSRPTSKIELETLSQSLPIIFNKMKMITIPSLPLLVPIPPMLLILLWPSPIATPPLTAPLLMSKIPTPEILPTLLSVWMD